MASPVFEWMSRLWRRRPAKRALALVGGGVIGGMYEVGVLTALDESLPGFRANAFDIYVGVSAGSVVASLMANGIRPNELYRILDQGLPDPMNFHQGSVYDRRSFGRAGRRFGRLLWAVAKNLLSGFRSSVPDLLSRAQGELPAGFFSLEQLETYMRKTFEAKGLSNDFRTLPRTLVIPAVDLDRAERVVFGLGALTEVPISQAIAASSAIPGFFEPYTIRDRDYVDGGVGYAAHADLAIDLGAELIVVVNPLVPLTGAGAVAPGHLKEQGLYSILEQSSRITSQNLLELGLRELQLKHPRLEIFLLQPEAKESPLFGPSMGFEASRAALRFGYASTRAWLAARGDAFMRRFRLAQGAPAPVPPSSSRRAEGPSQEPASHEPTPRA
ncbi:MAG: patatin-like phospholipase family protein [Candidatus Rokubacteria bacterium]|nr:patatin-like phospholipase family protein [Candidatus Rokubacteria bacterium]